MPKGKRYHASITINEPELEYDLTTETDSIDEAMQLVFVLHPDCTSMVISVVVNKREINE